MSNNDKTTNTLQLLKVITQKHISMNLQKVIAEYIESERSKYGENAAEELAGKLIVLLNHCKTEEEILEGIFYIQIELL